MGVGAPNGACPALQKIAHRQLFAGGLGVKVHEHELHVLVVGENVVHHDEGVVGVGVQREAAQRVHDAELPEGRFVHAEALAGTLGGVICRAQAAGGAGEIILQLRARPGVVAQRDHVRPGGEDLLALRGRHADDVGVLPVDHGKIDAVLLLHGAQRPAEVFQPRLAADVAHREHSDCHGVASFPKEKIEYYTTSGPLRATGNSTCKSMGENGMLWAGKTEKRTEQ